MHFVVVAPLTSLASPISNNYTVRIASHGSRDPDRSEAGRSWRRADTAAAFASRLQEETKENKRELQQHIYGAGGRGKLTGHQVLQIQLLLLLTLVAQADRSAGQQNGSQQTSTDACPGHNVRPIIDDLSVVAQYLNMEEHTLDTRTTRGREMERMREGESNSPCSIAGSNPRQRLSPSQRTRPYAKDPLRQRPADR